VIRRASRLALATLAVPVALAAQTTRPYAPEALSASDYARAEQFLFFNAPRLTAGTEVNPRWIDNNRFWYRNQAFGGHEFMLIDAAGRTRRPAFDHARLAAALSVAADTSYEPDRLPFEEYEYTSTSAIRFHTAGDRRWDCDLSAYRCTGGDSIPARTDEIPSPDGSHIATHRYDEREVGEFHLLETATGRPILHSWHYGLPGDSIVPAWRMHIFDAATGAHVAADMEPAVGNFTSADTAWTNVQWSAAGDRVYFSQNSRDYKTQTLFEVDASTGATLPVIVETGPTYVEVNELTGLRPNWRVLDSGREVVWFSERDGWGHLYLYDVATGALENRITGGAWLVLELLDVDEAARQVYFTGVGREPGGPYRRHLYRASLDGGGVTLLTPEDADHDVRLSPDGRYFLDTFGTREEAPITVLRDRNGQRLMTVQESDIGPLMEAGWRPPVRFTAKARDGKTDVHGFLFLHPNLEEGVRYPVVDYVYPGPQIGPIRTRGFTAGPRGQGHALAELGFITFVVDAIGTPYRSKAFHDGYYGNMGDNGIPDHISALKELALSYPLDLDRVGIFGHSGGGFASTDAILRYPDFFKVAVSGAGNHDNRSYHFPWGEKYQGLREAKEGGGDNYDSQANQNLAANLKGKLLLHYGTLDDNVNPNNSLLVAQQLIAHNRDFDMLVFPNRNHGYAREPYLIRRTWDYFVQNLMGATPPRGYEIKQPK